MANNNLAMRNNNLTEYLWRSVVGRGFSAAGRRVA
jgi:hypothetical protein